MNSFKFLTITILIFLTLLTLNSCDYEQNDQENKYVNVNELQNPSVNEYSSNPQEMMTLKQKEINLSPIDVQDFNTRDMRMIIKTGEMNFETNEFEETENKIIETVRKYKAYISNSSSQLNSAGKKQGTITIRVATSDFDNLVLSLKTVERLVNLNITGRDVTEEYLDLEARLKTQRELESRLIKLLQEKTANLSTILEVESKLAGVRENIEKTEGKIIYLRNQSAYSTLKVSYFEPSILNTPSGGGFFYEIGESISKGFAGLTKVIGGIITFVIAASPFLIIFSLFIYFGLRYYRRRKAVKV